MQAIQTLQLSQNPANDTDADNPPIAAFTADICCEGQPFKKVSELLFDKKPLIPAIKQVLSAHATP
jgi:hypothetical protein